LVDRQNDQADGLRRMFAAERLRVIHVITGSAGVGRLTVAVNLGAALAKAGRETLLIDVIENRRRPTALDYLGVRPVTRDEAARASSGPHGLGILTFDPASTHAPASAVQIAARRPALAYALITDSSTRCNRWLSVEDECREFVVVLSRAAASITDAYALVKRMSAAGVCRRFHVLINRVASPAEAALIFRNMSRAARGYLDVDLELLGYVPADAALEQATQQRRSVLDTASAGPAATAFARLAHRIAAWPLLLRSTADHARAVGAA